MKASLIDPFIVNKGATNSQSIAWIKSNTTTIDAAAHAEKMRHLEALAKKEAENKRLREALQWIVDNPWSHIQNMVSIAKSALEAKDAND